MKKALILSSLVAVILTGCGENIKSVSYYSENMDEADKVINQCSAGKIQNENCANAEAALKGKNRTNVINHLLG